VRVLSAPAGWGPRSNDTVTSARSSGASLRRCTNVWTCFTARLPAPYLVSATRSLSVSARSVRATNSSSSPTTSSRLLVWLHAMRTELKVMGWTLER